MKKVHDVYPKIYILGTNSSIPRESDVDVFGRGNMCILLMLDPKSLYIFDCGAGSLMRYLQIMPKHLRKEFPLKCLKGIFITHIHSDHVWGLPNLVKYLNTRKLVKEIFICGPKRIKFFVECNMDMVDTRINRLKIEFVELESEDPIYEIDLKQLKQFKVMAVKMNHGKTLCFGYLFEGKTKIRNNPLKKYGLDMQNFGQYKKAGILDGSFYPRLRNCEPVRVQGELDGQPIDMIVDPDECVDEPILRFMVCGDTKDGDPNGVVAERYQGKLLFVVHECTHSNENNNKPQMVGHSCPDDVEKFIESVRPKVLFTCHYSNIYKDPLEIFDGCVSLYQHGCDVYHPVDFCWYEIGERIVEHSREN